VNGVDDPYVYPGTTILRNRFEIFNQATLDRIERRYVIQRTKRGIPAGSFDLAHLRAIHRHLFQDVYDWAGQVRAVEINKGGQQFQFRQYIETGMADIHRRLVQARFLTGLQPAEFAREAGVVMGDVNYVHPFREGNGRTQAQYLKQLAEQAGHSIDLRLINRTAWVEASKTSFAGDYTQMVDVIRRALRAEC
jgi:cell filamentation protein